MRIAEIRPGGLVGEMALVDGKPRSANVRASEATRLLSLSRASYNDLKKTHPQVAYNILKPIKLPGNTAEIILQHHERLDGSGYPRGLTGYEIFLEARILGVADVLEAMCSHRPYRASLGLTLTREELSRNKGILYDAAVVEIGLQLYARDLSVTEAETSALTPTAVTHPQSSTLPTCVAPAQPERQLGGGYPWLGNLGAGSVPVSPRRVGRNY